MRDSQRQGIRVRVDAAAWPIPALVDRMLAMYMEWRETTDAIADSYRPWSVAPLGWAALAGAVIILLATSAAVLHTTLRMLNEDDR